MSATNKVTQPTTHDTLRDQAILGNFGRYSVAIAPKNNTVTVGSGGQEYDYHTVTSSEIGLWERFVNWFTGRLDNEKKEAYIGFIQSGKAHFQDIDGKVVDAKAGDRITIFSKMIANEIQTEYHHKSDACESMREWIFDDDTSPEDKKEISVRLQDLLEVQDDLIEDQKSADHQTRWRNAFIKQKIEDLIKMSQGKADGWRDSLPVIDD